MGNKMEKEREKRKKTKKVLRNRMFVAVMTAHC